MVPFSVLDLAPIVEGGSAAQAFRNCRDLARHVEKLGYLRFWLAEHHGMPGIASAATSVLMGYVAEGTSTIRVGAGGVMLPNHSPLVIAEQFGTLETLYPGRIDLGVGRAPGSDQATARALRRNSAADADEFPHDVVELIDYFEPAQPGQTVRAVPGAGLRIPVWILGSSLFGAQLAAMLGLPFAFASHFAPQQLMQAIDVYRSLFRPSTRMKSPYLMLGFNVIAADSDDEARLLASSVQQAYVALRTGRPTVLKPPVENYEAGLAPHERDIIAQALACAAIGSQETVRRGIADFVAKTAADELMIVSQIFDPAERLRSYEIAARLLMPGGKIRGLP